MGSVTGSVLLCSGSVSKSTEFVSSFSSVSVSCGTFEKEPGVDLLLADFESSSSSIRL